MRTMGVRADFYVGRGSDAEWLGSLAATGDPATLAPFLRATDEQQFRRDVARLIDEYGQYGIHSDQGWPWPWPTSHLSDYAYAVDAGKVHASAGSSQWFDPFDRPPDEALRAQPELPDDAFPRMRGGRVRRPPSWHDLFPPTQAS